MKSKISRLLALIFAVPLGKVFLIGFLFAWGVDGIITDRLNLLIEMPGK